MTDTNGFENALKHNIVYQCLTPDPAQALVFGGGVTGCTLHMPDDSLYLLLSRSDLWNEEAAMGAIAAVRIKGTRGLFTDSKPVRQVCSVGNAEIKISLGTPSGEVMISLTCLRGRNLLVVDISDGRLTTGGWTVSIENWHPGDILETYAPDSIETLHVNRKSVYADRNRKVGLDTEKFGLLDPLLRRAWGLWVSANGAEANGGTLSLSPSGSHRILVATACEPPSDTIDSELVVKDHGRNLVKTRSDMLDSWFAENRHWWRSFWEKSFIALRSGSGEAEYEERLWYVNLYAMACGMGGKYPLRFNGGSFLLEKDQRTWDAGYWGQNMRLVYFPMLAAGHLDFVREYIDWYLDNLPFVAAQTKSLFGIDGLAWPETQSFWGGGGQGGLDCHFTNNLEICLLMDLYYEASGDEGFLREHFYPALRGIIEFFRCYAKEGSDGRMHLAPAHAVEVWTHMVDPQSEVCGLRYFMPKAIAWAERFKDSAGLLDNWREFAAKLPEIPVGRWNLESKFWKGIHDERRLISSELSKDGIYLPAADQTRPMTKRSNMENAELYIVFPWNMVNLDSPEEDRRRLENTWNHRTWRLQNNGWAQDTVQVARMGWREELRQALHEHASFNQRFPNGLFISPAGPLFHGLLTNTPYFDTAGVHMTALEEMFLQNHDGVIKLSPAMPENWSGDCRLHASGGFVVELQARDGLPVHALITATHPSKTLRVRNHRWETMHATGSPDVVSGSIFERTLAAGESVELSWDGVKSTALPDEVLPDVIWPEYKIRGPLSAVRSGHWHDERRNHGQIGLFEDGLFPSTRKALCQTSR